MTEIDRSMRKTLTPLGFVDVALVMALTLIVAGVVGDRMEPAAMQRWLAVVWLGAVAQLGVLSLRRRLWERSTTAWEQGYGWIQIATGVAWSSAFAIDTTIGDPRVVPLVLISTGLLRSMMGVATFAGAPRIGRRLLAGLWGSGTIVAASIEQFEIAGMAVLCWLVCSFGLVLASRLLRHSLTEHQRSRRLSIDLAIQSTTDALTGLLNRPATLQRTQHAIDTGDGVTVLFIDLDGFTAINDRFGHATGDTVLSNVGRCLAGITRSADIVGRVGGDEFMVVLTDPADQQLGDAIAARVAGEIARCHGPIPELMVTGSVGTTRSIVGATAEDLLGCADSAMQRAKSQGGNSAVPYLEPHID